MRDKNARSETKPTADPQILGKILVLQAVLQAIPTPESLADFLIRGLETMPGTRFVAVRVTSFVRFSPEIHRNKEVFNGEYCQQCLRQNTGGNAMDFSTPGKHHEKYFCIRIQTVYANYGCLFFEKNDSDEFEPYQPYLENLANTIALTLELRNHETALKQVNEELMRTKEGLEIQVQARTKELTLRNEELQRWAHIFEHAEWGIAVGSADGVSFELMNPAFASIHGYTVDELEGKPLLSVFAPEARAEVASHMRLAHKNGHHIWESVHLHKDGSSFPVLLDVTAVHDERGELLYPVINVQDITKRKRAEEHIHIQLERLNALHKIDNAIKSSVDLHTILKIFMDEVAAQLNVDAVSICLFNHNNLALDYAASRGFRSGAMIYMNRGTTEGYARQIIFDRETIHIPDLTHTNSELTEALQLSSESFAAYVGSPLIAKDQVVGVLELYQRTPLTPDRNWFDFLDTLAGQAAIAIDGARLLENLQHSNLELTLAYDATIEGWSRALDLRDKETEGHTQRVAILTVQLAQRLGIPEEELSHIRHGALLHDIGKMGIPDHILFKPDKLSPEEWDIMRNHTIYAFEMLQPIQYLRPILDIPRYHHEKWDGMGYPYHLKGEDIPFSARIFAVVDVWDALTSDRPYRSAWPKEKALEYIKAESGKHFDPKVADIFTSLVTHENGM